MDIVPLKSSHLQIKRAKRDAVRRHTTEVSFEQLRGRALSELERDTITSLSTENLSGESYNNDDVHPDECNFSSEQPSLNSSWNSLYNGGAFDTRGSDSSSYYVGSQDDVFKELNEIPKNNHLEATARHQYQLSYELALDNMLTPFIHTPMISPLASTAAKKSKPQSLNPQHVIDEMVTTEQSYIRDLTDIIDGYLIPFNAKLGVLPIQPRDIDDLFGNILEIRDFHQSLLVLLFEGGHNPGKIANCFLEKAEGFKIYTEYCNNYPRSIHMFKEISQDPDISTFLKRCQLRLHHMLPLDAFLLKPVQRVLKYSPLLYEMGKRTPRHSSSYEVVQNSLQKMTDVAQHINTMKQKYDMAMRVQEIQTLMQGDWTGLDLTKYGDLVLEENMRYGHYSGRNTRFRTERYVFLFQQLCLITKKEEDGYYYLKAHIQMADLQLTERVDKLPQCFQLRQVSTGKSHTFMAYSQRSKEVWVRNIKLLLVESIPHLPDKAKQLIMQGFDVTPDQSPKRERHMRHHSEEPRRLHVISHPSGKGRHDSINKPQSAEIFTSQGSDRAFKPRVKSSTLPSTGLGSLMSMMASPVHESRLEEEQDVISLQKDENILHMHKRDSEFLESPSTSGDISRQPKTASIEDHDTVNKGKQRRSSEPKIPFLSRSSSSSPQIGMANVDVGDNLSGLRRTEVLSKLDVCSHAENKLDFSENKCMSEEVQDGHTNLRTERFSLPNIVVSDDEGDTLLPDMATVVIPPPILYSHQPQPADEVEGGSGTAAQSHAESSFTREAEIFFDELMNSYSETVHSSFGTGSSHTGMFGLPHDAPHSYSTMHDDTNQIETTPCHDGGSDDNTTPLASPHTSPSSIRRWSVKKRNMAHGNIEDLLPTPTASPYMNRPFLLPSSHISSSGNGSSSIITDSPAHFQDLGPEPDTVPTFSDTLTAITPHREKSHIVRRHSFGHDMKKRAVHHHQESYSTETTPQSTPIMKRNEKEKSKQIPSSQFVTVTNEYFTEAAKGEHSMLNVGSFAQIGSDPKDMPPNKDESSFENELSPVHKRNSIVLPPPVEFAEREYVSVGESSHEQDPVPFIGNHSSLDPLPQVNEDSQSSNQYQNSGSHNAAKDEITVVTPYESNPEEMMSFTEVLASFDDFASTTGKTTKSIKPLPVKLRSQSPEAKRRKQKKKKRSQTVANIDADTMNQVKEELSRRNQDKQSNPQQKSDSKVHKLAREYSRKIKDHQRSRLFKRFSTVVDEPSVPTVGGAELEPEWLQQLKERKRTSTMESKSTAFTGIGGEPHHGENHRPHFLSDEESLVPASSKSKTKFSPKDQCDLDEQQRKSGFKGWMRSLVDKISTSTSVKDK